MRNLPSRETYKWVACGCYQGPILKCNASGLATVDLRIRGSIISVILLYSPAGGSYRVLGCPSSLHPFIPKDTSGRVCDTSEFQESLVEGITGQDGGAFM